MTADLEIVRKLEREFGQVLARHAPSPEYPGRIVSSLGVEPEYQDIMTSESYTGSLWSIVGVVGAYHLNKEGRVVELKITRPPIWRANFFPLITTLAFLRRLKINQTELAELPPEIQKLGELEYLDLADNRLSRLPSEIRHLTRVQYLDLARNELTSLPREIEELRNLEYVDLANNRLEHLPAGISKLHNLRFFDLHGNAFRRIPPSFTELRGIEYLDFRNCRLSELPVEIKNLTSLKRLDLRNNYLEYLPSQIVTLDLQIEWEMERSVRAADTTGVFLAGNPLKSLPLEIRRKGSAAVRAYIRSLEEEKIPLDEVKVLLVGDGGSGKTSLMKRLIGKKFDPNEEKTHGINIVNRALPFKDGKHVISHLWDFGGQEIMHASHQFFLSKRSIYILVLDGRKDEKTEYWLKHIESFGGTSPIFVLLNKIDENPSYDVNRKFLKEKYRGIVDFFRVSCRTTFGLNEFVFALCKSLGRIQHLQTTWAWSWFNVKRHLEETTEDYISIDEYVRICREYGVNEESAQETLINFLHDLGVILHFRELALQDLGVLNPRWVTEAVYRIINSRELADQKGILRLSELESILKRKDPADYFYPKDKHRYIVWLMNKFHLCYLIDDETMLVPDLLGVEEPEIEFDYDSSLKLIIDYEFLPKSVVPAFIVIMNDEISNDLCWRTGVVLKGNSFRATAIIKADEVANKILIYVSGDQKRDYLSVIRHTFRKINERFEKIEVDEMVPIPGSEICVPYEELLGYELSGRDLLFIGRIRKEYRVKELLSGIASEEDRREDLRTMFPREGVHFYVGQSQSVHQAFRQVQKGAQDTSVAVDLSVDIPEIRLALEEVKGLLRDAKVGEKKEVMDISKDLAAATAASEGPEAKAAIGRIGELLKTMSDKDSELHAAIARTQKGIEVAQRLGRIYNRLAQWLALPQIPDLFL